MALVPDEIWPPDLVFFQRELEEKVDDNPHFEYSWGGPIGVTLYTTYTPQAPNSYGVRFQNTLREPWAVQSPDQAPVVVEDGFIEGLAIGPEELEGSQVSDHSINSTHSYGYPVRPRGSGGQEPGKLTPDFMVDQYDIDGNNRRPLILGELKTTPYVSSKELDTFCRYLGRLTEIHEAGIPTDNVVAMLIAGGRVYIWYHPEWPLRLTMEDLANREFVEVHQPAFLTLLRNIRANNSPHGWHPV
ncbi:unnamed protein product [Rhizoctonia solani]|nr:unnamed protein product [Rhizoctonia solani]